MTRKLGFVLYVAVGIASAAATAGAQTAPTTPDASQMFLYALGLINTLLMALLIFHMNSAAKARAQRDIEINTTLREVQLDLKKLNDAVLAQYVTKDSLDGLIESVRSELKEEARQRLLASGAATNLLHRFELALAVAKIPVAPPIPGIE